MRRILESSARRLWHGKGGGLVGPLLTPFSLLYGAGVRIRNSLFDRGFLDIEEGGAPVISVGNLSVGGTGKTPVSRWFVERLQHRGRHPALVTRGYGEDEIQLHRRWNPEVPVVVAPRRIEGVRRAVDQGADVCVVDDGFQHRQLKRDIDIVLVSARDPLPARLLPRGPYREPLGSLRRADLILVTFHGTEGEGEALDRIHRVNQLNQAPPVMAFPFRAGRWVTLSGDAASAPDGPVLLVSSVARPETVAELAQECGVEVGEALAFPDHHDYGPEDLEEIERAAGGRNIVTTEKDAVKLSAHGHRLPPTIVLTLVADPDPGVVRIIDRTLERVLEPEDSRHPSASGEDR